MLGTAVTVRLPGDFHEGELTRLLRALKETPWALGREEEPEREH
jgi:hypothetical protein